MVVSGIELWGVLVFLSAYMPRLESECQLRPVEGPMQNLQQVDLLWSTGEWTAAVEHWWSCGSFSGRAVIRAAGDGHASFTLLNIILISIIKIILIVETCTPPSLLNIILIILISTIAFYHSH